MRYLLALVLVFATASPLHAQEYPRNAWGLIASPMASELSGDDLSNYEVGATDMSLGLGAFYQHVFSPRISGRFELSARQNRYETFADTDTGALGGGITWCSASETTVETVVVISFDRHIDMAGHDLRFSIGTGPVISAVVDQTIGKPSETVRPREGNYGKFGWMFDGGLALGLDPKFGVFARFRGQNDYETFGESDEADIVRKLATFGFHVGAEFGL